MSGIKMKIKNKLRSRRTMYASERDWSGYYLNKIVEILLYMYI